jgi:3-phenylpropionate/trans-cinnamate dioxygenase ferredoxin component
MSDWVRVCAVGDVAEDTVVAVEVGDTPVAVVNAGGEFHAIRDVCSHADVPLSEGDVEDCSIECWLHGSRFDLRTGKPTGLPATIPVPVYAVRVDGDDVLVSLTATPEQLTNATSQESTQ